MSDSSDADTTRSADSKTPLAFRAVRGSFWTAAGSYFTVLFGFLATLLLTRLLTPEDFGVFALASFFYALLNLRAKSGTGMALGQRREVSETLVSTHLILDFGIGVITLLVAVAAIPILRLFDYSWDVIWVTLALASGGLVEALTNTASILLEKSFHFRQTSLAAGVVFPLSYVPAFWLALNGGGYWSLVAPNLLYALFLCVSIWWVARRRLPVIQNLRPRLDRAEAGRLLRFALPLGIASLAGMIGGQFDNFLIGTFVGLTMLGFYDRAYRIAQWPSLLLLNVLNRTAFYTYAELQDDRVRLSKTVTMTHWLATNLSVPIALAIFATAPDLVNLLYGERWLASADYLRILAVVSAIRPMMENATSLFAAIGRPRLTTLTVGIEAAILVGAGIPATLIFGAVGTAGAVVLAFGVDFGVRMAFLRRLVGLDLFGALASPLVVAVLVAATSLILGRWLTEADWPLLLRVVALTAYGAGAFWLVSFLLRPRETRSRLAYVARLALKRGG